MDAVVVRVDQGGTSPTGTGKYAGWLRRTHRWIAVLFLLTVAANFAARVAGASPGWVTYGPLPPLFALMASGLVMLLVPAVEAPRVFRRLQLVRRSIRYEQDDQQIFT